VVGHDHGELDPDRALGDGDDDTSGFRGVRVRIVRLHAPQWEGSPRKDPWRSSRGYAAASQTKGIGLDPPMNGRAGVAALTRPAALPVRPDKGE